jgi:hypothetical protein
MVKKSCTYKIYIRHNPVQILSPDPDMYIYSLYRYRILYAGTIPVPVGSPWCADPKNHIAVYQCCGSGIFYPGSDP